VKSDFVPFSRLSILMRVPSLLKKSKFTVSIDSQDKLLDMSSSKNQGQYTYFHNTVTLGKHSIPNIVMVP
jgi:hypothetical protein